MKSAKLAPVFTALILTACHPPSLPPSQAIDWPPSIQSGQGIDLPTDASDVLMELQQSRMDFVARYYREPDSRWPALSASEAQELSSLGLKIVAVWESHSRDPAHFSYSSGYDDAMMAYQQARAIGQPAGSAIYFAVDFNARGQSLDGVDDYFRGIAAGLAAAAAAAPLMPSAFTAPALFATRSSGRASPDTAGCRDRSHGRVRPATTTGTSCKAARLRNCRSARIPTRPGQITAHSGLLAARPPLPLISPGSAMPYRLSSRRPGKRLSPRPPIFAEASRQLFRFF